MILNILSLGRVALLIVGAVVFTLVGVAAPLLFPWASGHPEYAAAFLAGSCKIEAAERDAWKADINAILEPQGHRYDGMVCNVDKAK